MAGPSRCPLCLSDEETANHLLLTCPFAQAVWRGALLLGADKVEPPGNIANLFRSWASLSLFCLSKKGLLKTSWMWIPKFICWKLWLERNNRIFRDESCKPASVISKIKALVGEVLESNSTLRNEVALGREENLWLTELVSIQKNNPFPPTIAHSRWEIRLGEQEFIKWCSTLDDHCLFFDGASKGNPSAAGGGGVILGPGGSTVVCFSWGLGIEYNNRAEALALWQGLNLALKENILSLSVFGDSILIIQALNSHKNPAQVHLAHVLKKIRLLLTRFRKISFYHILRNLNSQADLEANPGSLRCRRSLSVNNVDSVCSIP